ncbi:MAG: response regulator transcription factor [Acidiferrobacterales bacterium]
MAIKRILVVDDSATDAHMLTQVLQKHGFTVMIASSGEEGVQKAKSEKPDLILMDIVMPGMNGFQATRSISKNPETKDIPIIVCSSKDQETDKAWGLRQGAKDYIVKPVTESELMAKIKAL